MLVMTSHLQRNGCVQSRSPRDTAHPGPGGVWVSQGVSVHACQVRILAQREGMVMTRQGLDVFLTCIHVCREQCRPRLQHDFLLEAGGESNELRHECAGSALVAQGQSIRVNSAATGVIPFVSSPSTVFRRVQHPGLPTPLRGETQHRKGLHLRNERA